MARYKRIADRVRDDPLLSAADIPLPNINAKSITAFSSKDQKRANYLATAQPKVKPHRKVLSKAPIPEAVELPAFLPPPSFTQMKSSPFPTNLESDMVRRGGPSTSPNSLNLDRHPKVKMSHRFRSYRALLQS